MKSIPSILIPLRVIQIATWDTETEETIWPEYCIIWLQQGKGSYLNGDEVRSFKTNTIYCFRFLKRKQLQFEAGAGGVVFCFNKTFIDVDKVQFDVLFCAGHPAVSTEFTFMEIPKSDMPRLRSLVKLLCAEFCTMHWQRTEATVCLLRVFLLYLTRYCHSLIHVPANNRNMEIYRQFQQLLETHYSKKMSIGFYASRLAVSSNYLTEVVRKVSGFSASHHVQQRIIAEAKRKAFVEGTSLKEIAYELGFECPSYFSKFFKSYSGRRFCDFKKALCVV